MGGLDDHKPEMAMLFLQCIYAGVSLLARPVLLHGMSPMVFVVYRQAIATFVLAPIACFRRTRSTSRFHLGWRSFSLIFLASLFGVTINQTIYLEGIYLASASMGSAMFNLVPAVTFVLAAILGLEKVDARSIRSMAKIIGTIICVGGAVSMALLRGPKLLNTQLLITRSLFGSGSKDWLLGSLLCFGSSCCWAIWLILQVPASAAYPDHLSLSAWMCLMGALQSAAVTFFLEPDLGAWKLNSYLELASCFYAGVLGSGVTFIVQAWCISKRGPLFSAMFNPVNTIIINIFACIFLHEEVYVGSLLGAVGVIAGVYVVLWGKAKEIEGQGKNLLSLQDGESNAVKICIDQDLDKESPKDDLVEPFLSKRSVKADDC